MVRTDSKTVTEGSILGQFFSSSGPVQLRITSLVAIIRLEDELGALCKDITHNTDLVIEM